MKKDKNMKIWDELNIEMMGSLMHCGFMVAEQFPDYHIIYANDMMIQMMGYQSFEEMVTALDGSAISFVAPRDMVRVKKLGKERTGHGVYEVSYHMVCKNGEERYVRQRSRHKVLKNGKTVILASYADIGNVSEQERQVLENDRLISEQQAALAEEKLQIAIASSNLAVWEFLFAERRNVYSRHTMEKYALSAVLENVPESILASGSIHPDSQNMLKNMYESVLNGAPYTEGEVKALKRGEVHWFKIRMTTLYENRLPFSAICTAEDITREKVLLLRMEDEVSRREALESDLRGRGYYDLADDRIIEYKTGRLINIEQERLKTYSDLVWEVMRQIPDKQERAKFGKLFGRERLLSLFADGKNGAYFEYQREVPEGGTSWVATRAQVLRQPSSGHVVTFIYTTDIDEQKQTQTILNAIAADSYEGIVLINANTSHYRLFVCSGDTAVKMPQSGSNYWKELERYLRGNMVDGEFEAAMQKRSREAVTRVLETEKNYVLLSHIKNRNGTQKTVKIQYSYMDERKEFIMGTSMDISAALQEEKEQKERLETALLAAKQASSAKSDFLSRMSHEIRTPLNAILGMSALAVQAIGNDEEILDCISKIGISGHYLLSLINDILDMSRIESGKMLLHNTPFNFSEFVEGITTVIYGQAAHKGIQYETEVAHGLADGYIGDAMKLQQVLINILGNAVKFTSKGGKITFSISLISRNENEARIRFAVNDTGCGISEESIKCIFDPFEQQDSSITSSFGGSGLGLAIAKNLVALMGGSIHVRSIVSIGSEFTVEVPLAIDKSLATKRPSDYSFADLRTLIVDDDLIICESTSKTLQDIGMIPEWVTSGTEAVARVSELWNTNQSYDFILIDWKMPDMDGIETSRRIRRIVGPDVTIIIITSYDWASIEHEAKAAGVNLCVSKPMLKSTLVSAFSKATGELERERINEQQPEIDLSGKRILLAEDHPLNAEIATRLLTKKNCAVELAQNGLKAMECFATSPVGYYDAILMDIRMPIMDGLQAAANIRHWNKADAKSIPIIAMTANAFDEDVEKSKAAGMDAHLAKPIEPELLYRVLYRLVR